MMMQENAVNQIQNLLSEVARKTHKHVGDTRIFLRDQDQEATEAARIGLASLQKDPKKAISSFNTAYLVVLVNSYKKL